jgi:hypothetical protein
MGGYAEWDLGCPRLRRSRQGASPYEKEYITNF